MRITAEQDLNEIKLDIAELDIKEVASLSSAYPVASTDDKLEDKLIIRLDKKLPKHTTIDLTIKYSAGYYHRHRNGGGTDIRKPRSGFYFIASDENSPAKQAWTQGESLESRYWFPCLDDPQVKFPREIQVTVPEGYIVISNGEGKQSNNKGNTTTWTWIERKAVSTYLTSVVIGNFSHDKKDYDSVQNDNDVPLHYYWPKDIEDLGYDAMLTFGDTSNVMKIFKEYFGTDIRTKVFASCSR